MATVNTTTTAAPILETAWLIDATSGPALVAEGTPGARPVHALYAGPDADGVVLPEGFVARLLAGDAGAVVRESGLAFLDLGEDQDMVALAPGQLARVVTDLREKYGHCY